jgi:hypothetical protein
MYDDPVIELAFRPLSHLAARQATYLVFQIMLMVSLGMTYLFSLGGRWRGAVMTVLAVSMLCELHHIVRWLFTFHYNPGLVTSVPMPFAGAVIIHGLVQQRAPSCSIS